MKNKVLIPTLLFTIISCSESFNIDIMFGDSESDSINPGIDNAFASTYLPMDSEPMLFKSANIYDGLGVNLEIMIYCFLKEKLWKLVNLYQLQES